MQLLASYLPPALAAVLATIIGLAALRGRRTLVPAGHPADIDAVRALSWVQCQRLLAVTFSRRGYHVSPPPSRAGAAVDLVLVRAGQRILVHCRHWNVWTVQAQPVADLAQAVSREGAEAGLVLTCGAFADDADEVARRTGIELIDGAGLVELLSQAA